MLVGEVLAVIEETNWNNLLKKVRRGDQSAKDDLFRKLAVRLHPIIKYRLRGQSSEDIEDILQDTMVIFSEKINLIESDPDTYVLQILRNKIGNFYQRMRRRKNVTIQTDSQAEIHHRASFRERIVTTIKEKSSFLAEIESEDLSNYIRTAIKRLPVFCQTFFLAILDGRRVQEVWELYRKLEPELQRNAFDKRVFDCRKKLMDLVSDQIQ
ncbi:hypothetical protein CEE37_14905 [candidate division LCP-89 bacterium B3_LCP]|uniref:Uncharacterized protein n=1 Tax=candidate division LCP-89 bacterium B3_LCP TaxID=2012998 RepID=A0A532UP13_UNCL8|nr:MAG: hypothetical protein CEE37_14905 [candidate division LCP-89 bacterium B3_LCP]